MTAESRVRALILCIAVTAAASSQADLDKTTSELVTATIAGDHRSAESKARDRYRKPLETLAFLGLHSGMTVVEIWPGSGWYSEILAPVLQKNGKFYAAHHNPNGPYGYQRRGLGAFLTMLGNTPKLYRDVEITEFSLPYDLLIAPPGSVDMVVTFRNVHNLVMSLYGGGTHARLGFQAMFDALKPGGVLGVVDHLWDNTADEDPLAENGYISKERTVALAESAGFKLIDESELLRNSKDTKDYPEGVWTLPPTLALGDQDKARYLAIGESDRFLLKFEKPVAE